MRVLLILGAVALVAATPLAAQLSPSASGFSDAPKRGDSTEYWLMMNEMGACLAGNKSAQARAFLGTAIDSPAEAAAFDALFHPQRNPCLSNTVWAGMLRSHARGVVAEGLFERLPDGQFSSSLAAVPAQANEVRTLHDFARCFALAEPTKAVDLLRTTRVATRGESDYIRAIAGDFAPCLPAGQEVKLRPTSIRLAMAEALYRLATGTPGATIEKSN